jgi:hypothetical protein
MVEAMFPEVVSNLVSWEQCVQSKLTIWHGGSNVLRVSYQSGMVEAMCPEVDNNLAWLNQLVQRWLTIWLGVSNVSRGS